MGRPRPTKGPGSFFDIGKSAKDLLYKDYSYDQKLSLSSTTKTGITFEHTSLRKGEAINSDVKTEYRYKNLELELKANTASTIAGELAVNDPFGPGVQFKLKGLLPDQKSLKAEIIYDHAHAHVTAAIGLTPQPLLEGSVTVGQKGLAIGVEGAFDTASNVATKYTLGLNYIQEDFTTSLLLADKLDTIKWSYVHSLSPTSAVGVEVAHKRAKSDITFTAGATYLLDDKTTSKVRLNNRGIIAALVQHEFRPKSTVTISTEVDSKSLDKGSKFGVAIKLKP